MFYAIRHFTQYRYSRPVQQSVMEVRMHPRSENTQRCFTFQLSVSPRSRIFSFTDHVGNIVHHFDIPGHHRQLTIVADALVDVLIPPDLPEALPAGSWDELDAMVEGDDYWDMLMPSYFARSSDELDRFAEQIGVEGRSTADPLTMLRRVTREVHDAIAYTKESTGVDSPIEHTLESRKGVCQDITHISIALLRNLRIPCRYVSGYLYHDEGAQDRSMDGATHAWMEALLPQLGWVGFDPTNNVAVAGRHIRTAIGRDYADVPPTLGLMKGSASTDLQVRVRVTPSEAVLPPDQEFAADEEWSRFLEQHQESDFWWAQQQQQQQ